MDSLVFRTPPVAGDETDLLLGVLDRTRSVTAWKCGGLDAAGMRASLGPSTVTLGGLLKHLALVEDHYFSVKLAGNAPAAPWDAVDWDADPDWEWRTAADDTPDELVALWQESVERSQARLAEALSRGDMGQLVALRSPDGESANLRRVVVDLIEEYARHNGQADLIRESVDGLVGEEPTPRGA
jgi:uncharacterized damage-inducible protein DinB